MIATSDPSTFSFVGTVDDVRDASQQPGGTPRRADVRVEEVIGTPPPLGTIVGSKVVVLLPEHATVAPGQRRLFHTVGVSYGSVMTLRAVDVEPADDARLRGDGRRANGQLAAEVERAELIVVGQVTRLTAAEPSRRLTEHDPQSTRVVIRVDETLAGPPHDVVDVLVPASSDVMWASSPPLSEGEVAVFVLGPASTIDRALGREAIAIRPVDERDDIRSAVMLRRERRRS